MRFRLAFGTLAALTAALVCSVACKHNEAELSVSAKFWQDEVQTRRAQIEKVKAENSAGFEAMDAGSLGSATLEMIPFVVFRVLQEIEPATFGDGADCQRLFPTHGLAERPQWHHLDRSEAGGGHISTALYDAHMLELPYRARAACRWDHALDFRRLEHRD